MVSGGYPGWEGGCVSNREGLSTKGHDFSRMGSWLHDDLCVLGAGLAAVDGGLGALLGGQAADGAVGVFVEAQQGAVGDGGTESCITNDTGYKFRYFEAVF